jgi:site-specific recombinase XerD
MKIRFYQPKTVKAYRNALRQFLRWYRGRPHQVTREDVRCYLEFMVDGGAGSSWVGVNLSAIRTAFDKMCGRDVTLGLESPRRPKRLPVVLSTKEVMRLLGAAIMLRDKLLLGLLYATGVRVSEVVRLRWRDIDFDRRCINVWQGKGRKDRLVLLPLSFETLLKSLSANAEADDFLFPSSQPRRHLSPRTVGRVMQRTLEIAKITKRATPHSLRHSFASHSLTNGMDIRFIQKLLGHMHLETTTIYTRVALPNHRSMQSPLDVMEGKKPVPIRAKSKPAVGRLQIHMRPAPDSTEPKAQVTLAVQTETRSIYFTGIVVRQQRPGWHTLELPALEDWNEPASWLTPPQRERFVSPEFYKMLEGEISRRFTALLQRRE